MSEEKKSNVPEDVLEYAFSYIDKISKDPDDRDEKFKKALENLHLYYDKVLPKLAEPGITTEDVVTMLVESCLVEKNFEEGMDIFLRGLFSEGVEIETDQMALRRWVEKLSNLRLYRKIIHLMGLGAFEQELVEVEIRKTMEAGKPPTSFFPIREKKPE